MEWKKSIQSARFILGFISTLIIEGQQLRQYMHKNNEYFHGFRALTTEAKAPNFAIMSIYSHTSNI